MKPILVTGITGFLGTSLLRGFRAKNGGVLVRGMARDVRCVDRDIAEMAELLEVDVTNPHSLEGKFRGINTVVHLASKVAASDPEEYRLVNVEGTRNVADQCVKEGVEHIVYVSSAAIYGFAEARDEEEHEPRKTPSTPVSRSRYEAEKVLLEYHGNRRINISILRPLFVYGNGDRFFIPAILRTLRRFPFMINNGKARFSVVSAPDLGNAILSLISSELPRDDYPVYHITDGVPVSLSEVVYRLCEGLKLSPPRISVPYHVAVASMILGGIGRSIFSRETGRLPAKSGGVTSTELRHRFHLVSYDHYFSNRRLLNILPHAAFSPFLRQIDAFIPYYRSVIL